MIENRERSNFNKQVNGRKKNNDWKIVLILKQAIEKIIPINLPQIHLNIDLIQIVSFQI